MPRKGAANVRVHTKGHFALNVFHVGQQYDHSSPSESCPCRKPRPSSSYPPCSDHERWCTAPKRTRSPAMVSLRTPPPNHVAHPSYFLVVVLAKPRARPLTQKTPAPALCYSFSSFFARLLRTDGYKMPGPITIGQFSHPKTRRPSSSPARAPA